MCRNIAQSEDVRFFSLLVALLLLTSCAGRTLNDPVTATTVDGTPQAVIEGVNRGSNVLVQVRLNNPGEQPIQISDVALTVVSVSPNSCPRSALELISFPQPIVPPASSGMVVVKVGVSKSSPASCSDARWLVTFSSRATVAS